MTSRAFDHPVLPPSLIRLLSWQLGAVPQDWKKASTTPVFRKTKKEDMGNHRQASLTSANLGSHFQIHEGQEVIRSSQHRLTKGKSCLTDLISFCNEVHARAGCHTSCEPCHVTCLHDFCILVWQRVQCGEQLMVDPKG